MKQWMYPLMIVFAASCYGILSTIIKLAIHDGFTASEAVTSQYFIGFVLSVLIYVVVNRSIPKFGGGITFLLAGLFTATTGLFTDKRLHICPHQSLSSCSFNLHGLACYSIVSRIDAYQNESKSFRLFSFSVERFLQRVSLVADISGIPWQGWAWGMASAVSFSPFVLINQKQVKGMDTETRLLFTSFFAAIAIFFFQSPEIVWNGMLFGKVFGFTD